MSRHPKKIQASIRSASKESAGVHLWLILWKAHAWVSDFARSDIASLGLGLTDFAILELLLHKGATPVNEIGARVLLTSGSMTSAVDRLEKRKLVERRSLPGDRRSRMVYLTDEGRSLIECAFAAHSLAMNSLFDVLTPAERSDAERLLKKMGRAAEAAQHSAG